MTTIRKYALALLAGALLASGAAPPLDLVPALWLGMAALAWLLDGDPGWPPYSSERRIVMQIGERWEAHIDPGGEERCAWAEVR